jgi:small-conductance mechanosensitive channel
VIRIIVFVLVLSVFGFELGGIWALVSTVLAMIAIGFVAVWSLLSHSTATILLVIIRPFQIGDDIALPSENMAGRVIDLNFFFTTLLDHEGNEWRVPNNLFFQKVMKRTKQPDTTTLSSQLNNPEPATVTRPPAPTEDDPIRS